MEPHFQRSVGGTSSISYALSIPENEPILQINSTKLTQSNSPITPPETRNKSSIPTTKIPVSSIGSTLKRQLSTVTTAAPQYFRTIRPALSVKSISMFNSVDIYGENSILSDDDDDLVQDWHSDSDQDKDTENNTNLNDISPLKLYKQQSTESNASSTDYNTFTLLNMGGLSAVGYKNFWRQHTIEESMTAVHRKKKKKIKQIDTTLSDVIKMQQTISVIPLRTPKQKMSRCGTIFTIINVYVNNTMLYNSYAFMKGGLISILIYGLICFWLCYCAKLVIKLFKKVPNIFRTFPGVTGHAYGWIAHIILSMVIILENMGRTMIALITLWANILFLFQYEIYSKSDTMDWESLYIYIGIGSSLLVMPLIAYFVYLSDMYAGGILMFISTSLLSILILMNFISIGSINYDEINFWPQNAHNLALGIGIFISNLAGHACLPSIYSQMENPKQFDSAINISWIIIFFIQMLTGIIGYLTFGDNTTFILTHSMIASGGNQILTIILIVLLIINLYFHIPIAVVISVELPENALQIKHPLIKRIFHVICFFIIVSIAWLLRVNVAMLSAVIGSVLTLTISMLCPLLFKLHLDKKNLSCFKAWILRFIIVSALIFAVLLLYIDILFRKSQQQNTSKWI